MSESASLTADQAAVLAAIVERLIPTDETGPGAREARVVRYIERSLATHHGRYRAAYIEGLAELGDGFAVLGPEQQDAVLAGLERDGSPFFELVRRHAIEGMFGDPAWGGNEGLAGWELLGYPGPRLEWTDAEQR